MKRKINLTNPIAKLGIQAIQNQAKIALETTQDVEKAIIPIYIVPKSKGHQMYIPDHIDPPTGILTPLMKIAIPGY